MLPRRLLLLGTAGVLLCGWARWAAAAASAPSVQDLAAATIRNLGLQTDLPRAQPLPDLSLHLPDIALWAAVIAALAVILYSTRDMWRWSFTSAREQPDTAQLTEADSRQASRLARAEHLAQQGSFADAMHELLLEGFREIRERAQQQLADSLTSREVLRTTLLPEHGRAALRAIVMRVEWTYFGEHAATRADYRACRDSFDTLHAALRQAASA